MFQTNRFHAKFKDIRNVHALRSKSRFWQAVCIPDSGKLGLILSIFLFLYPQ